MVGGEIDNDSVRPGGDQPRRDAARNAIGSRQDIDVGIPIRDRLQRLVDKDRLRGTT